MWSGWFETGSPPASNTTGCFIKPFSIYVYVYRDLDFLELFKAFELSELLTQVRF
ncbi:hypothetical protein HMPREF0297_1094 [Corynebacterium jeikeium ATCC 43734]|nr:hypothetical protein HMPREF0297_1094 [Corynebacterium jeikeium ATCC 43734]